MTEPAVPPNPAASITAERAAEIDSIVAHVTAWATGRPDITAVLLVGSCARGSARPDSDIDLMVLSTDPQQYTDPGWYAELGLGVPVRIASWGPVTEYRFVTGSGLEVEVNVGAPDWAEDDPVDPGTYRVVSDGARNLYDPSGAVDRLLTACRR